MLDFPHLLALVPVLPLLGAVLSAVFGSIKELKPRAHVPAVFCAALSCACALAIVAKLATDTSPDHKPIAYPTMTDASDAILWFGFDSDSAKFPVEFALSADQLTGVMLLAITFIGFWIRPKATVFRTNSLIRPSL